MIEKRYILEHSITVNFEGRRKIPPSLDASNVKDKDLFYRTFLTKEEQKAKGTTDIFNREEIDKVIIKDWKLDYLLPRHIVESEQIEFICDMHSWIREQPDRLHGFPISKRMKEVLEKFNLHSDKFYEAKVLFQEKFHDYFLWEQCTNGFDKFVDFENSIFCERNIDGILSDDIVKVTNQEELLDIEDEKEWWNWSFKRAVMKSEFKEIDCLKLPYPYGTLINERLKKTLEESNFTGFEIKPFPINLEYS